MLEEPQLTSSTVHFRILARLAHWNKSRWVAGVPKAEKDKGPITPKVVDRCLSATLATSIKRALAILLKAGFSTRNSLSLLMKFGAILIINTGQRQRFGPKELR